MSKYIYVNSNNTEAIEQALRAAQGRATTRVLTAADVLRVHGEALVALNLLRVPVNAQKRIAIRIDLRDHRQPKANSYGHAAAATSVRLELKSQGWVLVDALRSAALYDTVANSRDFFLEVSDEDTASLLKDAAARAFGITLSLKA